MNECEGGGGGGGGQAFGEKKTLIFFGSVDPIVVVVTFVRDFRPDKQTALSQEISSACQIIISNGGRRGGGGGEFVISRPTPHTNSSAHGRKKESSIPKL